MLKKLEKCLNHTIIVKSHSDVSDYILQFHSGLTSRKTAAQQFWHQWHRTQESVGRTGVGRPGEYGEKGLTRVGRGKSGWWELLISYPDLPQIRDLGVLKGQVMG